MTTLFILYLVLVDKPRFDESNIVGSGLTMEECEQASGELNYLHHALSPDATSRYLWVCGPMPPAPPPSCEDCRPARSRHIW